MTSREVAFCLAYVADPKRNGTAAAVAAGYAASAAHVTASRLLKRDKVLQRIAELEAHAAEAARLSIADVVARYTAIIDADPNDLVSYEVGPCRYCHGHGHAWQWRNAAEFRRAFKDWEETPQARRPTLAPSDDGGYGYSRSQEPNSDCPECDGDGEGRVVYRDSRSDHPLFAGLKVTRHGIEIRMHDKMQALDALARILGAFREDNRQRISGGDLGEWLIDQIRSNRAQGIVLNRAKRPENS